MLLRLVSIRDQLHCEWMDRKHSPLSDALKKVFVTNFWLGAIDELLKVLFVRLVNARQVSIMGDLPRFEW